LFGSELLFYFLDALVERGLQIFVQGEVLLEVFLSLSLFALSQQGYSPISIGQGIAARPRSK
jgi:hypothetical protein